MSAVAGSSSGRVPQGEVIIDFADGGSYIKHKLEESVLELERRRITQEEGRKAQAAMSALEVKDPRPQPRPEDVDYIVKQGLCTRAEAEEALREAKGELVPALISLVKPAPRARSVDGGAEAKS